MTELPPPGPPDSPLPPHGPYLDQTLPPSEPSTTPPVKLRAPFRYAIVLVVGVLAGWTVGMYTADTDTATGTATGTANRSSIRNPNPTRSAAEAADTAATDSIDDVKLASVLSGTAAVTGTRRSGSAVLINATELVTNAHVVEGHSTVRVRFPDSYNAIDATVTGTDPTTDLALLTVPPQTITPIRIASDITLGEPVIAVGYALNLDGDPSITRGIISAEHRTVSAEQRILTNLLQTDTPISSGNSGGPLVNLDGELVGINTAVYRSSADTAAADVGFAIRADTITPVLDRLRRGEAHITGYLGVVVGNRNDDGRGAVVFDVDRDSPADIAGLQPGDIVVTLNGIDIQGRDDLVGLIRTYTTNTMIELTVLRDDTTIDLTPQLTPRPGDR